MWLFVWLAWNLFIICFYLDVGALDKVSIPSNREMVCFFKLSYFFPFYESRIVMYSTSERVPLHGGKLMELVAGLTLLSTDHWQHHSTLTCSWPMFSDRPDPIGLTAAFSTITTLKLFMLLCSLY